MSDADRCDFTDLLKDQCGHCRPERLPQPHISLAVRNRMSPPRFGPWISARFDSECDGCGDQIEEGDQIRSNGEGGWICLECGEQ